MSETTEIFRIIHLLKDVYDGTPWHGPSIKSVLNDLQENESRRAFGESHEIIQILGHMVAWREFVIKKLDGDETFDIDDSNNFPDLSPGDWKSLLNLFEQTQSILIRLLEPLHDEMLMLQVPGRKYDWGKMIYGLLHHDLYHLGQISLLKKYGK